MYRIRFHGRGGQGMKTASRILGNALFAAGFEVQDAPRYGAERRGAPIFAYVRADHKPINERGIITQPDLVIVADDTLIGVPAAGILAGINSHTVLLISTNVPAQEWQQRLNLTCKVISLPVDETVEDRISAKFVGASCAGAAAALLSNVTRENLAIAIRQELGSLGDSVVKINLEKASRAYDLVAEHRDSVQPAPELSTETTEAIEWIELPFENADISAPTIHAGLTSVEVRTGLWRTLRPVIEYDRCSRCWWVCSTYCPDSAINVKDNKPVIDYDHCKGCMI